MTVTYYLEVLSSWCHWAEPMWAGLQARFAPRAAFRWKIALMRPEDFPASRAQCDWFYRRSGTYAKSPYMLNSGWWEAERRGDYSVPNRVVEAARDLGATDDRVRLAVAHAAVREGQKMGRWEEAVAVAARAGGVDAGQLRSRAESAEIAARLEASTAEFHALQLTQRPAFLLENAIGDRAVFSGLIAQAPLAAAIEAMLEDSVHYASWAAHVGAPPKE